MAKDIVFGEVDWNSGDASTGGGKASFMKLTQGTTTVRVMSNPHQFYIHWLDLPDGTKKKINSPISSPELLRKLEDEGFRRKPRWIVKVLDRSDDEFKLLEIGSQIYNGIRSLYKNEKWGKVTEYDLDIHRGKPGANPLYSVTPNPKERLDSSLKGDFMEFNDSVNLDALTRPADPDEVRKLMGWDETSSSSFGVSEDSDDDDDFEFDFE